MERIKGRNGKKRGIDGKKYIGDKNGHLEPLLAVQNTAQGLIISRRSSARAVYQSGSANQTSQVKININMGLTRMNDHYHTQ